MKRPIVIIVVGTLAVASLASAEVNTSRTFDLRLYGFAQQFEWKESFDGKEFLKESGPLFGVGGELGLRLAAPLWLQGRGEVFFGDVDYDGAIMTSRGELIPYKSTTQYAGIKGEGHMAFRFPLSRDLYVKPYVGLGLRVWRRTLDTAISDTYIGEWGYVEDWMTMYGILGCGGGIALGRNEELFGRVEGRLPISNSMTADLTNVGGPSDVELKPGRRASIYLEGGFNATPITLSLFIETLTFSESPLDNKYQAAFQPESNSTMIGAKFGLAF